MENVVTAITMSTAAKTIIAMGGSILEFISGNELMFTLFCGSFVALGCSVVRKIKKTSKV